MMEPTERALFADGVRHATQTSDGPALDEALDDLGWRDALEADRSVAVIAFSPIALRGISAPPD